MCIFLISAKQPISDCLVSPRRRASFDLITSIDFGDDVVFPTGDVWGTEDLCKPSVFEANRSAVGAHCRLFWEGEEGL
jgi:hypothetical protein